MGGGLEEHFPTAPEPEASTSQGQTAVTKTDLFDMIAVANPRAGDENQSEIIFVYRTWTAEDVKKAVEGITPYKDDVNQFCIEMEALRDSYKLNGLETQQAWMAALGFNWSHVRGDWDPSGTDGKSLKHDAQDLTVRVQALAERTKTRYKKLANYGEISRTKQKEDEKFEDFKIRMTKVFKTHSGLEESDDVQGPYQQQLKNALHAGVTESIRQWLDKHFYGMASSTLEDYVNHAIHAEKVVIEKNKKKDKEVKMFLKKDGSIYYKGGAQNKKGRGGFQHRGRGRRRYHNQIGSQTQYPNTQSTIVCWSCGKSGHKAKNCKNNSRNTNQAVHGGVPSEYKLVDQIASGFESFPILPAIFPVTPNKN
ncbi:uncharacterized protein LOC129408665 isoform X2 [Boleophthalmus pectinirostris]|nr:uncharacterized protein LOC129408665 isoform X2 [Boleophthalmus pectinirostris]